MADITSLASGGTLSAGRTTINDNFTAVQNDFAGSSAPASPVAYQPWVDTSAGTKIGKRRDPTNASWLTFFPDMSASYGGLMPASGGTFTGTFSMSSTKITSLANGTASGDAVNKGQVDAKVLCMSLHLGTFSASDDKMLFVVPANCTIIDVNLANENSIASDAVNYWTFQVRNLTAAVNLRSSAKSTNGAAITADTAYALGLDQNLSPSASDVLELQVTKGGAPSNLTETLVTVHYTVSV